jgi:hypothetical protein
MMPMAMEDDMAMDAGGPMMEKAMPRMRRDRMMFKNEVANIPVPLMAPMAAFGGNAPKE